MSAPDVAALQGEGAVRTQLPVAASAAVDALAQAAATCRKCAHSNSRLASTALTHSYIALEVPLIHCRHMQRAMRLFVQNRGQMSSPWNDTRNAARNGLFPRCFPVCRTAAAGAA